MSDSELVIVDTDDMIDPFQAEVNCGDMSPIIIAGNSEREVNSFFDTNRELGSAEKSILTPNNKKRKRARRGIPTPNLTYDKDPYQILIKSGFVVKTQIENIPDSTEKKCYFSFEGFEICIKFPMRADSRNTENIKKIAAQKAINFILSLDRVPARLSHLVTVPNKSAQLALRIGAKNPVTSTPEFRILTKQNNKRQVLIRRTSTNTYENFRNVCQDLVDAGLVPDITFLREQDMKNGVNAQFVTRLPNYEIEFFGEGYNRMTAKLASVSKALNYAKKNGFGSFVGNSPSSLSFDRSIPTPTPHHYTPQYRPSSPLYSSRVPHREASESELWEEQPQKKHVSVHSRLAPPLPSQHNNYGNASTTFQQTYHPPDHAYPSPSNEPYDRHINKMPYFDPVPQEQRDSAAYPPTPHADYPMGNNMGMSYGDPYYMPPHGFQPYGQWKPPFERGFESSRGFKRAGRRGKKI